jgi:hypothetical protein
MRDRAKSIHHVAVRTIKALERRRKKRKRENDDMKIICIIEHGSMFLHLYIFLSLFFIQQENVSSLSLCIHVACVNKQTTGEPKKKRTRQEKRRRSGINREIVYKNEQNGTNTRRQPMRQNRERETDKKRRCRMN